ncbi:MAG TPA: helix-turn-helix transcriptional regulator [Candidatus Gastranaerophilales bacterium]|nr:helix-turn-helix transcriptional regulator [Candidatus Gastranaerophilales bacterium]
MDKKKFCEKLRTARIEAGYKQEHAAKHLNLPISAISVMESGARKIDVFELKKLADFYNKPIEWFFHEHNSLSKRRWYDLDPVLSEAVDLLRQAPTKLQKSAAYGIIGFLKQGGFALPDDEM